MSELEPPAQACLDRTRSAVLNVLLAVGVGIAASGFLLRTRDPRPVVRGQSEIGRALLIALFAVVVASYTVRRVLGSRVNLRDPAHRCARLFRSHVVSAVIGAVAVPLGFLYGWMVRPQLDAVAPFWVASLALGFLALPRAEELRDFDDPLPEPTEPRS